MSEMKILMVGTQGQMVSSGPGTFMRYLSEAISEGRLQADILYPHEAAGTPFGDEPFVHCSKFAGMFHLKFPGSWILTALYLWVKIRCSRMDKAYKAVWFADRFSALFCVMDPFLRSKLVVMVNDDTRIVAYENNKPSSLAERFNPRWISQRLFYWLEHFICHGSRAVISNSNYLSSLLEKEYALKGKVWRLYKAVDLSRFKAVAEVVPSVEMSKSVLFLKNEWQRGGLDVVIEALATAQIDGLALRIAGMDLKTEKSKIEAIIENKEFLGEVEFIGRVAREDVPKLIGSSDVFCVPSRIEALGVAFLEALASGTAVIGTKTGGIPEVLAGGKAGWLVPVEDAQQLSIVLKEVVTNQELREKKKAFGLKHAAEFSTDKMIENIVAITTDIYG